MRPPALPCIRCGECAAACPAGLYPQAVLAALQRDDLHAALALGLDACDGCTRCDAVCPSAIPLSGWFTAALTTLQREQSDDAFARVSRQRYHFREARLLREQQEQAAERERKRASNASADAVAQALARAKARRGKPDRPA